MPSIRRQLLFVALALAAARAALPQEDDPRPRFRAGVTLVELDVVATDDSGAFVDDLGADDFEVFENGERRELATFQLVELPRPAASATGAETDVVPIEPSYGVASNDGVDEGRILVLVLDDLHVAPQRSPRVREVVRQFLESSVGPADQVSIAYTSGAVRPFGSSRRSLLEMADAFTGRRLRSSTLERLDQQAQAGGAPGEIEAYSVPTSELERGRLDRATLRHLSSQCEILEPIRSRRKAIVWVSEGLEYDFTRWNGRPYAESLLDELRRLQDRAASANVVVYSINPGGLESVSDDLVQIGSGPSGVPTVGVNNSIYAPDAAFSSEDAFLGTASLLSDQALATRSLRQLPALTGGLAIANRGELPGSLARIVDDVGRFYLLGFVPEPSTADAEEHRLEVRARRPGVTVRTRTGYGSAPGAPPERRTNLGSGSSPVLRDALSRPIATSGLPLRVVSAPMGQDGDEAEVVVVVSAAVEGFQFESRGREIRDEVEVWVGATDRDGRLVDSHAQRVELQLPSELRSRIEEDGFRASAALRLEPGRYQLRVAVHELGAGHTGTVVTEVEIPEVDENVLRGLSLSSERESRVPVAGFDETGSALPLPPVTTRSFDRDDALIAYLEVAADDDEGFELLLEVRGSTDDAVLSQVGGPVPPGKKGEVLLISKQVGLSRFEPGDYRLVFRALSLEGETLVERSDRFTVR